MADERIEAAGMVDIDALIAAEERRVAAVELAATNARIEQILAIMPTVLIGTDANQRIILWNARAAALFAIPAEVAIGRPFAECGIAWDFKLMMARINAVSKVVGGTLQVSDIPYTRPNGQVGLLAVAMSQLPSGSGQQGLLVAATDMTESKAKEVLLMQAQKLESIGQLAAGVAHEINTPIQFVGDNLRFLESSLRDLEPVFAATRSLATTVSDVSEPTHGLSQAVAAADLEFLVAEMPKAVAQAIEGVERVASIVRALKDFSHPDAEAPQFLDLRKAIENTINVARSEYKYVADVHADHDPDLPAVQGIPGEINQVILNLLVNAAHAIGDVVGTSGGRGTITVSTRRVGDQVEIRIADTGTGIPEHARARLFDPFFTTKPVGKGTGQGLYIAHTIIVQKHHGSLTFETEMGRGTTFIIRLPIQVAE